MLFNFPVHVTEHIRALSLLLNTAVLILVLILIELIYSERTKEDRTELRYFYPLSVVLILILAYASYLQGRVG